MQSSCESRMMVHSDLRSCGSKYDMTEQDFYDEAEGNEKSGRKESQATTPTKSSSNSILVLLLIMVALTWGIAATAYFGIVDYRAVVDRSSSLSTSEVTSCLCILNPLQYQSLFHPLRTIADFLILIDDTLTGLFKPREKLHYVDKRRPIALISPITRTSTSWKATPSVETRSTKEEPDVAEPQESKKVPPEVKQDVSEKKQTKKSERSPKEESPKKQEKKTKTDEKKKDRLNEALTTEQWLEKGSHSITYSANTSLSNNFLKSVSVVGFPRVMRSVPKPPTPNKLYEKSRSNQFSDGQVNTGGLSQDVLKQKNLQEQHLKMVSKLACLNAAVGKSETMFFDQLIQQFQVLHADTCHMKHHKLIRQTVEDRPAERALKQQTQITTNLKPVPLLSVFNKPKHPSKIYFSTKMVTPTAQNRKLVVVAQRKLNRINRPVSHSIPVRHMKYKLHPIHLSRMSFYMVPCNRIKKHFIKKHISIKRAVVKPNSKPRKLVLPSHPSLPSAVSKNFTKSFKPKQKEQSETQTSAKLTGNQATHKRIPNKRVVVSSIPANKLSKRKLAQTTSLRNPKLMPTPSKVLKKPGRKPVTRRVAPVRTLCRSVKRIYITANKQAVNQDRFNHEDPAHNSFILTHLANIAKELLNTIDHIISLLGEVVRNPKKISRNPRCAMISSTVAQYAEHVCTKISNVFTAEVNQSLRTSVFVSLLLILLYQALVLTVNFVFPE